MKRNSLFVLVLSLTLCFSSFAQTTATKNVAKKIDNPSSATSVAPKSAIKGEDIEADMAEALTLIQDNHVNGKKLDYNELFKSSIDGMLHTLDPHSNYFDAKEFEAFRTEQRSEYFGIGATIGDLKDGDSNVTFIRATFDGSPAYRAGLRYGDKIVEVNGTPMRGKAFFDVRNFLRGERGTTAKVKVQTLATGEFKTVDIVRDAVPQPSIPEIYMIRPGIGYIAMTGGFNQTTAAEFRDAMRSLKSQGMQQLVLDLRGNGGGLVSQAYQVASAFLGSGQVVFSQKGRAENSEEPFPSQNPNPDKTPLVLLVNRGTASASEILSGALQDHDRALIVGEPTFGKGLVQNPFQLPYGSALLLTIAKYQTPSGRNIQRDYSNSGLYDYYTNGGTLRDDKNAQNAKPSGTETKTDAGRTVYGGDGITPDENVKPLTVNELQQKLNDPIFGFALNLSAGKVAGFNNYAVNRPIDFKDDIKKADFPVTNEVYAAFKKYVASDKTNKLTPAQLDKERAYIERQLRFELATATYGSTTSFQVYNEIDPQVNRAIELLPKAGQLALTAAKMQRTTGDNF